MKRLAWFLIILSLPTFAVPIFKNQNSDDITLGQAYVGTRTLDTFFDIKQCKELRRSTDHGVVTVQFDCTEQMEKNIGATSIKPEFDVSAKIGSDGDLYLTFGDWRVPIIIMETVSKVDAFDNATNVGMFYNWGCYNYTYPKSRLKEVARTSFKNGDKAVVHRFFAPFVQTGGTGNNTPIYSLSFKPFMDFFVEKDNIVYRNWDRSPGTRMWDDYRLTNYGEKIEQIYRLNNIISGPYENWSSEKCPRFKNKLGW